MDNKGFLNMNIKIWNLNEIIIAKYISYIYYHLLCIMFISNCINVRWWAGLDRCDKWANQFNAHLFIKKKQNKIIIIIAQPQFKLFGIILQIISQKCLSSLSRYKLMLFQFGHQKLVGDVFWKSTRLMQLNLKYN